MTPWDLPVPAQRASTHARFAGLPPLALVAPHRARVGRLLDRVCRARVLTSSVEARAIKGRPDMTSLIPESIFTWVNLVGTLVPPRDPNDDDDEEEEEDDDHEADEDREPAVSRGRARPQRGGAK